MIEKLGDFSQKQQGWSVEPNNYEGIRVTCGKESGDGWFLLRLSLHDPLMPLNVESNTVGGVEVITGILRGFFREFAQLDASSL